MFTGVEAAKPRRKIIRDLRGRRLVVVDIENVLRGPVMDERQAAAAYAAIEEVLPLDPMDHVVVATNPGGMLAAGLARPGVRSLMGHGPDGADLKLLEVLTTEHVEERYDEVVVVSGDHIFATAVAQLGGCGVSVTVLAHPDGCSRTLRMAAAHTLYFKDASDIGLLEAA